MIFLPVSIFLPVWFFFRFFKHIFISTFSKWGNGKQSSMLTTCHNSVVNPLFLGRIHYFWPLQAWIWYLAGLATPRYRSDSAMSALCIKFQPSGAEKTEFTPLKNESPSFSYQVVKKGLFFTTLHKKKWLTF